MKALPVGTKRHQENGYVRIKMFHGQRRWSFEHRAVWEEHHGIIPKGKFIHHLNHNPSDNRIENLILVNSNSEHHRLYHHKRPSEHGRKISHGLAGKPKSEGHRRKISLAAKGKPKSLEHRRRLSEIRRDVKQPNISKALKGRKLTPEWIAKIKASSNLRRNPLTGRYE